MLDLCFRLYKNDSIVYILYCVQQDYNISASITKKGNEATAITVPVSI